MSEIVTTRDSKSQSVVMVMQSKFESQPCLTINHTNDETLEGSISGKLLESLQTHLMLGEK